MYNLIDFSDIYSKTFWSVWQHYRDETALNAAGDIIDFPTDSNNSASFKF